MLLNDVAMMRRRHHKIRSCEAHLAVLCMASTKMVIREGRAMRCKNLYRDGSLATGREKMPILAPSKRTCFKILAAELPIREDESVSKCTMMQYITYRSSVVYFPIDRVVNSEICGQAGFGLDVALCRCQRQLRQVSV